jgi:hypothetical protein
VLVPGVADDLDDLALSAGLPDVCALDDDPVTAVGMHGADLLLTRSLPVSP